MTDGTVAAGADVAALQTAVDKLNSGGALPTHTSADIGRMLVLSQAGDPVWAPAPTGGTAATAGPGATGSTGSTGPTGPTGAAGTSIAVKGHAVDLAAANALPGPHAAGDAYLADDGHLLVFDGTSFADAGKLQGPAGPTGPTGPKGETGATGPQGRPGHRADRRAGGLCRGQRPVLGVTGGVATG